MSGNPRPNEGSPKATLLLGVSLYALASYWPELTGITPSAVDDFYSGIFAIMGGYMAIWAALRTYAASHG